MMRSTQKQQKTYAEQMKGKSGVHRIWNACGYSWDGLKAACSEQGFRQLLWLNGALLVLLFFLPFGLTAKMVLVMASFLSLIVELFNTGVEAAVDHTSLEKHDLAKRAKDVCSAAQSFALCLQVILWLMALWRDYGI